MEISTQRSIFTGAVRSDPEYRQLLESIGVQRRANPKPVLVTGLCEGRVRRAVGGALRGYAGGRPVLIVCPGGKGMPAACVDRHLSRLRAAFYPVRDLNFTI